MLRYSFFVSAFVFLTATSVFSLQLDVGSMTKEWTPADDRFALMVTVSTPNSPPPQGTVPEPLQVLYLMDVSERFAGNARQEMINGGIELVRRLSDNDFFGIIVYGEYSRVILPLSQIGFTGRERINSLLSQISTERGRNPLSALDRTALEFSQNQGRDSDGRSLVMSVLGETFEDGEGNSYAPKIIRTMRELGVQVYTVGHGDDFDEDAAIALAEETGGRAYFTGRDRPDLLKNRFDALFRHVTGHAVAKNVVFEFLTRDGITVTGFRDSVFHKVSIPKLVAGDTVNLFFDLNNRPRRSSDIDVDFNYENTSMRSNMSGSASFKVNLARGNSSDFAQNAERVVRHQLLFNMAQSIDDLKIGDRAFRRAYAEGFRRLLETRLGFIRDEINTREIQRFFSETVALYDMINGGTASDALVAKTVKYQLHNSKFSE